MSRTICLAYHTFPWGREAIISSLPLPYLKDVEACRLIPEAQRKQPQILSALWSILLSTSASLEKALLGCACAKSCLEVKLPLAGTSNFLRRAFVFIEYTSSMSYWQGLATLNTLLADGDKLLWSAAVSYYAQVLQYGTHTIERWGCSYLHLEWNYVGGLKEKYPKLQSVFFLVLLDPLIIFLPLTTDCLTLESNML